MLSDLFEVGAMTPGSTTEHRLFSVTHPDVDESDVPADAEVLTFDAATGKWKSAPAAGGVTDHGLLDGLLDHDHPQYPLLAGLSGGQHLKGGLAASEHLTLQSTAHATRGYVRAQDDLQLLSGILRSPAGTTRLTLADARPEISLAGDVVFSGYVGSPSIYASRIINIARTVSEGLVPAGIALFLTSDFGHPIGIYGGATWIGATANKSARGLDFKATSNTTAAMNALYGMSVNAVVQSSGNVSTLYGATIEKSYSSTGRPVTAKGLYIGDFGKAGVGTAYGLQINNQTNATINRCLEVGPSTPFLRVEGGAAPAGVNSSVVVNFGGTLYRLTRNAGTGAVESAAI